MRLAKEGYGAGNPEKILAMNVTTVINLLGYEMFLKDYEAKFLEINKEDR